MSVLDDSTSRESAVSPEPQAEGMDEVSWLEARFSCLSDCRADHWLGSVPTRLLPCKLRNVRAERELQEAGRVPASCDPTSLTDCSETTHCRVSGGVLFPRAM